MTNQQSNKGIDNRIIALVLFIGVSLLLYFTSDSIGVTWDEPAYIPAAQSYSSWFKMLFIDPGQAYNAGTIDLYWAPNHEHPPVAKAWAGLIWLAARQVFHISNDLMAIRLGPVLMVAILVALLYTLIAKAYGKAAGLFAALALLCMPRFFFHAHLASLDVPVSVMWGLAVATKLNGVFILIVPLIWILFFRRNWANLLRLVLMGLAAMLTFFVVWPWLYHQTWTRLLDYVNFHVNHFTIGQWFQGVVYTPPPWFYVYLILWAVVPITVMGLFLLGVTRTVKSRDDGDLAWLLIINLLVAILPFSFGKTLLYDNDRLFMPVYPFIAALAGIGFGWLIGWIRKYLAGRKHPSLVVPLSLILGVTLLVPQSLETVRLYPHLLSYFSEGVGGLRGATRMGLETTYWCETYAAAIPFINAHANPGDTVWTQAWSFDVLKYYQKIGRLRRDVVVLNIGMGYFDFKAADWYILESRQTQYGEYGADRYLPFQVLSGQVPVYVLDYQGVPLMELCGHIQ